MLFNVIPKHIRDLSSKKVSVDGFKKALDEYLALVPEEPQIRGYTAMRQADSNSLVDMHHIAKAQLRSQLEERRDLSDVSGRCPQTPRE